MRRKNDERNARLERRIMAKAGAPQIGRTRDKEAVTRRTANIGGLDVVFYDGVQTPPPKIRWRDIAEAMKPGEAIVVNRPIDADRISAAVRKLYGNGCCLRKQRGNEIWVWRVDPDGVVVPHRNQRKRA